MSSAVPERSESVRRFLTGLAAATRVIRAGERLSQAEVARRAGVGANFVAAVEHARANPTSIHLDKLAHGLGLNGISELAALAVETADRITTSTIRPTN